MPSLVIIVEPRKQGGRGFVRYCIGTFSRLSSLLPFAQVFGILRTGVSGGAERRFFEVVSPGPSLNRPMKCPQCVRLLLMLLQNKGTKYYCMYVETTTDILVIPRRGFVRQMLRWVGEKVEAREGARVLHHTASGFGPWLWKKLSDSNAPHKTVWPPCCWVSNKWRNIPRYRALSIPVYVYQYLYIEV